MMSTTNPEESAGEWQPGQEKAGSGWLIPSAGFLALALIYILTSPVNRSEADDAFWYAWDVERLPWTELFQPFHLFYLPLGRLAWLGARFTGLAERSYPVLTVAGGLAAAGAALIAWDLLVRRLAFDRRRAALAVGLLAFSYGFWRYSAEAEVYALALLWCAAIANLALADRLDRAGQSGLILLGATAPLVHILAVTLAGVAAPVAIALRRGVKPAARYLVAAGGVGFALAWGGYRLAATPVGGLFAFYSGGQSVWSLGGIGGAIRHAVAASQVVVSGNFLLTYSDVRERIAAWFPSRMLADEIYAGEHAASVIAWAAPVTLVLLLAASVWFVLSGVRTRDRGVRSAALTLGATWLVLHVLIGVLFSPAGQPEVWMLALLPAWLLVVCLLVSSHGNNWPLAAMVATLFAHNLIGGLWVYDNPKGDRGWAKGGWLIENSLPEDAILTADSPVFARYLRYWARAQVVDLQFLRNELRESWTHATGVEGSVFATDDVFRPPSYYRVLRPVESDSLLAFGSEIEAGFSRLFVDEFGGVWQLDSDLETTGVPGQVR